MPRKRSDVATPADDAAMNEQPEVASESGAGASRKKKGIFVPTTDDGTIDFQRFKEGQREKFEDVIRSLPGDAQKSAVPFAVNREFIPTMYDAISMVIQTVGKFALKWPADLAGLMRYSEEQKEKLTEPTAKVIERYSPKWLLQNQELAAFLMAFTTCTKEMIENAVITYVKQQIEKDMNHATASAKTAASA